MIGIATSKILVRNLAPEVLQALELMANSSDRSLEAEARVALRAWVQPVLFRGEKSVRRVEVAQRLHRTLDDINQFAHKRWKPSHIAQGIGEAHAEQVEEWFVSRGEPSFDQLARIAAFTGVRQAWLQHGEGAPYPVENIRLSENPTTAVQWLLNGSDSNESDPVETGCALKEAKLERLIFVRAASEEGQLAIVKQWDSYRSTTYTTPLHVSHRIGAGGERQLVALAGTLELLYQRFAKAQTPTIKSLIVPVSEFSGLVDGKSNPLAFHSRSEFERPWWEDLWDRKMSSQQDYWPGWKSLTDQIQRIRISESQSVGGAGQAASELAAKA